MPGYRGHIAGGCCVYAGLMVLHSLPTVSLMTQGEWLLCTIAGALFPDIDIKSRGQKYFYWAVLCVFGVCFVHHSFVSLAVCSVGAVIPMLVRHRGIFHAWWFSILVPLIGWGCVSTLWPHLSGPLWYDMIFFVAGALSHIVLDKRAYIIRGLFKRW